VGLASRLPTKSEEERRGEGFLGRRGNNLEGQARGAGLGRAGQAHDRYNNRPAPLGALIDPAVCLIQRLTLRGEGLR